MIVDRNGHPFGKPRKILTPIGQANPEDMRSRARTKSGKPRIRIVAGMKGRDFVIGDEQYTPMEQNLDDETLFRLRVYRSPTAAFRK